ncbi:unnamed protein product [Dovyalis caffra]|uniref:Uncharacterized protein n=1 Tax=Dovyalis caffra TaxID=77055 RepID=A0AAV1QVV5_9ROSI|nr:unnamed protein product [Dovyalis caffra]
MAAAVGVAELSKPDTPRRIEGELRAPILYGRVQRRGLIYRINTIGGSSRASRVIVRA